MAPSASSPGWKPQEAPDSSALFCAGDRSVFRSQVQGPWDLSFICFYLSVFLYKEVLGFAFPLVPTDILLEPGITWQMRSTLSALKLEHVILKLRLHNLI